MPPPTILSSRELQRIRQSVNPEDPNTLQSLKAAKRAQLKKLSNDRLKNWPNTLEALRKKKESYMKDKAEKEENERREVDRQEAEIRKQTRMTTIKRANDLLYEQTDKMKNLKSQLAYADAIAYRKIQVQEKSDRLEKEKKEAAKYHEYIVENCKRLEAIEMAEKEERQKVTDELKAFRAEQMQEVMNKKLAEIAENEAIGAAMKKRAEDQVIQAALDLQEKDRIAKETTANMYKMNAELKIIKQELKAQEAVEAARRDAEVCLGILYFLLFFHIFAFSDISSYVCVHSSSISSQVAQIDERNAARKALEQRRFERKQEARQKIIDAAIEQMTKKSNHEQAVQERQEKELNDKADKAEADKKKAAEDDWNFTVASRTQQLKAKADAIAADKALDEKLLDEAKRRNDLAHEKEQKKAQDLKASTYQIKALQYADGVAAQRKRVEDRIIQIEQDKLLREIAGQDDTKFVNLVNEYIEKYKAEGKPVYTLMRALDYREPQLIPAMLQKGKRTVKGE